MILLAVGAAALLSVNAAPLKLAAPGLQGVNVDEKQATLFTDYFAQQLSQYGVHVTTAAEIATLIGLERQKQLLGCSDSSGACMAELAGALGVDGVISGNVAKIESQYVLTIKIVKASDGSSMGNYSGRMTTAEEALDWLGKTAREFAVSQAMITETKPTGIHLRKYWWLPAGLGAGALGVGAGLYSDANGTADKLRRGEGDPAQLNQTISSARSQQQLGVALMGLGAAGLVTAVVFIITGNPPESTTVMVNPTPGGASMTLGGSFR
ncbi:MAG: hypothetical protein ACJ790_07025 [Myxococcaceae bacterium]